MSSSVVSISIAQHDPNTYANNREAKVTHSHLDLDGQTIDSADTTHSDRAREEPG